MRQSVEVIRHWIKTVNEEGKSLTAWEENFMEKITVYFEKSNFLSDKQEEILEQIYADKTP